MRRYKVTVFDVPVKLLVPETTKVKGKVQKTYPAPEEVSEVLFGSFRTFGGTENTSNDVYTIYDTATMDTWYRPDITSDCRIYLCETGETYDIINHPENIGMRHQYLQLKLQKVGGTP